MIPLVQNYGQAIPAAVSDSCGDIAGALRDLTEQSHDLARVRLPLDRGVSSWRRISPDSLIPQAKASGQYLNNVLAKVESMKAGYQEAILLDDHGYVCEGTGENIYIVVDGEILTPGHHNSILDGITRSSVVRLAADLGYAVSERNIARAELYLADEIFMSGTAAELVPVVEVDDHKIGSGAPGEVTKRLQSAFDDAIHGRSERYREWLDLVPAPARASAA